MKSAQEIEIKFAAPADVLPRLQHQLPAKGIRTAKPKSVVSVYFDTDKLDLRKHGLTLRVRRNGRQRRRWKKILKRGRKLRDLASPAATQTFLRKIEPLQDGLGDLNDIVVDRQLAAKLTRRKKRKRRGDQIAQRAFAAGELAGQEEARIDAVLTAAEKSYAGFARVKPFW